jgi:alanyl-tRNA synthetase
LGYETLVTKAKLLAKIKLPNAWGLVFDQTPFYGESGGQIGDRGIIKGDQVKVKVVDTIKPVEGYFIHIVEDATTLNEKNSYELNVDSKLRNRTAHNHSATHLLQSALINILGSHVKQAGSLVTENKLRFDFTHSKKITTNEIIQIEDHVNKAIQNSLGIDVDFMSKDQAIEKGAMALFGEKYGDSVRVITMGDESIELCGGTHVKNTNEIGIFKILSEASLSTGVRRIEALTGIDAYEYLRTRSNIFEQVEQEVSLKNADVLPAIVQLKKELKNKNKTISELEDKIQQGKSKNLFEDPINLGSHNLYLLDQKVDKKQMKKTSDFFMDQYPEEVLLILNTDGDKLNFLARINKKSPISLKSFAQEIFKTIDGRGGGKEDMIQGSFAKQDKGKFLTAFKTLFN